MLFSLHSRALGAAALLGAMAVGAAHAGAVSGTLLDDQGHAIDASLWPFVALYQCDVSGTEQDFCTAFANGGGVLDDGTWAIATDGLPAGKYQLVAGANDFSTKYTKHFKLEAEGTLQQALLLKPLQIAFAEFNPCTTLNNGWCDIGYQVTNHSTKDVKTQVWAQVTARTNMPTPDTQYSSGNGGYKPTVLTLAAGETRQVTQSVYVGTRDTGAYSIVSFFASPPGQPNQTTGFSQGVRLAQTPGGVESQLQGVAQQLVAQQPGRTAAAKARQGALQAGKAAAAKGTFIVGTLTAADTGVPLPVALSPRMNLWICLRETDEFCSQEPGEFVYLDETGKYQLNTTQVPAGRYQFEAQARGGYGIARSPAFNAPTSANQRIDLSLSLPPMAVANVSGCDTVTTEAGACTLSVDLANTTGAPLEMWTWVNVNAYMSGSPLGVAIFTAGTEQSMKPSLIKLDAGQTKTLQFPLALSKKLKSGAEGGLRLYMGRKSDPSYAEASVVIGNFFVTADGSLQRRAVKAQK
ncbi:hypothetical protein LRH25_29775 [Ideonella azotifigens]|uniref:Uncharacterized protein n=2 Tax=Ideonella azotifigens TaxID=513160 RepID=A0ABP3VNU0_9BURK|nr:hypothetical protein [Ideonella azotifigens]MCD2344520.1 hypothetical protein [Ideonella azotifigens]